MVESSAAPVSLGDQPLSLTDLEPLLDVPFTASITPAAWQRLRASRQRVLDVLARGTVHYGINTGFGRLKSVVVSSDRLEQLQKNLILSHCVGVGSDATDGTVRWMMLLKLQGLLQGGSGVSTVVVQLLLDLLNHDCLPIVPTRGSLGASGDLAPLAHMVLPMIGQGQVRHRGRRCPAGEALAELGLSPLTLHAKDGLALVNGTQYMAAIAAAAVVRGRRLARLADVIAAMSLEAYSGSIAPFDDRFHQVRPHPGAQAVAANLRLLLADSDILKSHEHCGRVQDPYSFRCVAPVHGASRTALEHAAEVVQIEINSVTDNPVVFDNGDVLSGGNFHGQPLALVLDYLALGIAELAGISERRTYLLLGGGDGLPTMLVRESGINSGLMMLQYTAAALVNENKVLSTPASVDSIPSSMGQEDHVSMGATSANKLLQILDNAETVLAIELLCAAQGLDFRAPLRAGVGARVAHEHIRARVSHVDEDRRFDQDIQVALQSLRAQDLLNDVTAAVAGLR